MHTHDLTLGLAFGLGALHALEPGHGKTAMLVYLSGERRSFLHPVVMGLSSAISHSVSLIAIAAMVHLTHHLLIDDHEHAEEGGVTLGLQWASAILVMGVGIWMCVSAWRAKPANCGCSSHKSSCDHDADQSDKKGLRTSYSMSALLGVAFGLLPCPSALAAYFTSMSSGSPVAAYGVIGLFAAGIAFSLTLVGIAVQAFGGRIAKSNRTWLMSFPWAWTRAILITGLGVFYLYRTSAIA